MEGDSIYPWHGCQWGGRVSRVCVQEGMIGALRCEWPITVDSVSPSWYKRYLY